MQADIQKFQAETQMTRETEQIKADAKLQEIRANLELQAANDQRDSQRERDKAMMDAQLEAQRLEFDKWKAQLAAEMQIYIEQMKAGMAQATQIQGNDINAALAQSIDGLNQAIGGV